MAAPVHDRAGHAAPLEGNQMNTAAHPQANPVYDAAIAFHNAGCCVVPVREDGTKAPVGTWKQYQTQRSTPADLDTWFGNGQAQGFGIVCGAVSGGFEMLEVEGRAVADGFIQRLVDIIEASGLDDVWATINAGYVELTPSGGVHWYYRISDGTVPGNTKLAQRPAPHDRVEPLAETRGEGGFTIVAPSHGRVHPEGGAWRTIAGTPANIPTISMDMRDALHTVFRMLDEMPTPETVIASTRTEPRDTERHGLTPGDDYNARADWADLLVPLGWSIVYRQGDTVYWRRPHKNVGVSATTGRNSGDNLFVFTTSSTFTAEKPYSKFAAYAHLHHHDDYSAAARELRRQGYGTLQPVNELKPLATINLPQPRTPADEQQHEQHADEQHDEQHDDEPSTWKPVDLTPHWNGTHIRPQAGVLWREDGIGLLYPGRVHSFYGESESGKSWLAQIAAAEVLRSHGTVAYIDFEADAADIVDRLQILGVDPKHDQRLRYIRPETARNIDDPYWHDLIDQPVDLIIIDGVTEALTIFGGETKDNDLVTRWVRIFPRALARATGAAVVTIDHVAKNTDSRGRFAIGGQAKLAAIDGAAYLIEPIEPIAPNKYGMLTMRVTKDRPGTVRAKAGAWRKSDRTQEAAVAIIDSTTRPTRVRISAPRSDDEIAEEKNNDLQKSIVEYVIAHPRCTKKQLKSGVRGEDGKIVEAVAELIDQGMLIDQGHGNASALLATELATATIGQRLRPFLPEVDDEY